jgi:hypothetical protein
VRTERTVTFVPEVGLTGERLTDCETVAVTFTFAAPLADAPSGFVVDALEQAANSVASVTTRTTGESM